MTHSIVLRDALVDGVVTDVRCEGDVITAVGPGGRRGDVEVDVAGGVVLPGLHDHHLHLLAMAAARASISVEGATTPAAFDAALRAAPGGTDGWRRVVGYHETPMGPLDRRRLDALVPAQPVRAQHATGALWVLNSAGLDAAGVDAFGEDGVERDGDGRPTGRLYGLDERLRSVVPETPLDLAAVGAELAGYGLTGVTDLTPTDDPGSVALLAAAAAEPGFPLDVTVTGGLGLPDDASPELPRGPVKLLAADHALPDPGGLACAVASAHRRGRAVAVHCASRIGLVLAVAALEAAGSHPGDRIEHGAVIPLELIPRLLALDLTVVTQPAFVEQRGDRYLHDVPVDEHADLWRCGSLRRAGVAVAAGSDAPYGSPDPWRAIAAATTRRTRGGRPFGPDERTPFAAALGMYLTSPADPAGPARRVAPDQPARLCVLEPGGSVAVRGTVSGAGWVSRGG